MGFFSKLAKGLTKTRESMVREVAGAFGKGKLTDQVIENVEEKLLAADIGMDAAAKIMESVKERARGLEISSEQLIGWMAAATRGNISNRAHSEGCSSPQPPSSLRSVQTAQIRFRTMDSNSTRERSISKASLYRNER